MRPLSKRTLKIVAAILAALLCLVSVIAVLPITSQATVRPGSTCEEKNGGDVWNF